MSEPNQGKRIAGLAVAGFATSWFIGPLGVVLSAVALSEINHNQETLRGKGLAKWGIALGVAGTLTTGWLIYDSLVQSRVDRANAESERRLQEYYRRH